MRVHDRRIGLALTLASSLLGMAAAGCDSSEEETLAFSADETQAIANSDRPFTCVNGQRVSVWSRLAPGSGPAAVPVVWSTPGPCAADAGAADVSEPVDGANLQGFTSTGGTTSAGPASSGSATLGR
jgi:hypothetical protein